MNHLLYVSIVVDKEVIIFYMVNSIYYIAQRYIMVEASLDVAAYEQLNLDGHDQEEIHQNLICSGLEQNSASSESN